MRNELCLFERRALRADFYLDPHLEKQYPPDLGLEPIHLDLDLRFDIPAETLSASVTTTVLARRADVRTLTLDAVAFETVAVADVDADAHPLKWRYDGEKIFITWDEPFRAEEQRRVTVRYRVVKPVDGLFFSHPEPAYPNQPTYVSSDHETERARFWIPCVDTPNVRAALDFHIHAPAALTVLANGARTGETVNADGSKTTHWTLSQRCPSYLIAVAVGDFVRAELGRVSDGEKEVEVVAFGTRNHTVEDLTRTFGRSAEMLGWLVKRFGAPFPYSKLYQLAVERQTGAMENISLIIWPDYFVLDEILAQELSYWLDCINSHEIAHQFFGDAIVCRDFAHAWLKEGWATFLTQMWWEENRSRDEGQYRYYLNSKTYFKEADEQYQRPIVTRQFKSGWQMYDRHLYEGCASRLSTLRHELGDEIFWRAAQDYVRRYSGQVVETADLQRVMEEHSGRSLGKFFDQWFFSPGYPALEVKFDYDSESQRGTFEIRQTQENREKGVPLFTLSADLLWVIDGEKHRARVTLEKAFHAFVFSMPARPTQVRFDPDGAVLHKLSFNPGDDFLRAQLTGAADVIGRILAGAELIKTGRRANLQAVLEAYPAEPFWGVRCEWAKALGESNAELALTGLMDILARETEPRVLYEVFHAAGNYRDARLRDALLARLEAHPVPYLARGAAYEALGAQGKSAPWEFLRTAAGRDDDNGFTQMSAMLGLASTGREEAVEFLKTKIAVGDSPNRSRYGAVYMLAKSARDLKGAARQEIVDALTSLLRDSYWRVRMSAEQGLEMLEATDSIPTLEAYSRPLSLQDRVRVERLIHRLRAGDSGKGALQKQVDELRDRLRALDEQIQKVEARLEK